MAKLLIAAIFLILPLGAQEVRVDNPAKPEGSALTLAFSQDLRIGPEGGQDSHIWTGASVTFAVNDKGHIFVVESAANRILEFNGSGEFVRVVGKEGEGPDEFQSLSSLSVLSDGTAVAFENMGPIKRLTYYDKEMKYVKRVSIQGTGRFMRTAYISPSGEQIASFYMARDPEGRVRAGDGPPIIAHTGILDLKTKPLLELTRESMFFFNPQKSADTEWWSRYIAQWLGLGKNGLGVVAFGRGGEVYSAVTNKYEVTKWSPDLKKQMVVTRSYKPISQSRKQVMAFAEPMRERILSNLPPQARGLITESVARKAVELVDYPPRKPPIFGIAPMEDGGFIVVHDYNPLKGSSSGDLFNKDGRFLGQAALPKIEITIFGGLLGAPLNMVFTNGFAYVMEHTEDGEPIMVRYRYQLKPAA